MRIGPMMRPKWKIRPRFVAGIVQDDLPQLACVVVDAQREHIADVPAL
jgi:hypothetical protein